MGHALASGSLAAGRVDAQHDGLHVVVLHGFLQGLDDVVAVDTLAEAFGRAVHHVALGIDDGYLVLNLLALLLFILGVAFQRHQVLGVVAVFQHGTHVLLEEEGVDQTCLGGIVGQKAAQIVGRLVQLFDADVAASGDIGCGGLPDAGDIGTNLFAVGRTHVAQGVYFAGALVGTAFGTDELHLDAQLVEQVFVVQHLGAHSAEVNHAAGVEAH